MDLKKGTQLDLENCTFFSLIGYERAGFTPCFKLERGHLHFQILASTNITGSANCSIISYMYSSLYFCHLSTGKMY